MTLVAAYKSRETPVLVGDVLITGTDCEYPLKKVSLISQKFVVGWTGRKFDAVRVLKALFSNFENCSPTKDEVQNFLIKFDVTSFLDNLILVGWIIDDGGPHSFIWQSENNRFGVDEIYFHPDHDCIAGSGEKVYREILKSPHFDEYGPMTSNGRGAAKKVVLAALTRLSYGEFPGQDSSWRDRFGFAYEALICEQNKFKYLNDMIFLEVDLIYDRHWRRAGIRLNRHMRKYTNFGKHSLLQIYSSRGEPINRHIITTFGDVSDQRKYLDWYKMMEGIHIGGFRVRESQSYCIALRIFQGDRFVHFSTLQPSPNNRFLKISQKDEKTFKVEITNHLFDQMLILIKGSQDSENLIQKANLG